MMQSLGADQLCRVVGIFDEKWKNAAVAYDLNCLVMNAT